MQQENDSILRSSLLRGIRSKPDGDSWRHARVRSVHCCASGCGNIEREHPGKVFYVFPSERDKWTIWLKAIKRPDLVDTLTDGIPDDARVCSDHFQPCHYTARRALRDNAVPRLGVPVSKSYNNEDIVEVEPVVEPSDNRMFGDPAPEDPITIQIENQRIELDPLALVKSEPIEPRTDAATQTFTRQELYLAVATRTEPETMDLPPVYSDRIKSVGQVQTTKNLLNHFITPVKRQLEAEIREVNKKIKLMNSDQMDKHKFAKCCDKYLNEKIANIVKSHSHVQDKFVGNRYGHDFKMVALNLYLSNPQSYKFVEQIFNLPARVTFKRLQSPARTGINPNLMEYLKIKVNKMSEKDKVCAICFDAMHISKNLWYEPSNDFFCGMHEIDQVMGPEPAEYAAALIVRGLYTKWTQPVSFAYITEKRCYPELKEWLHKVIATMFDIGLDIKVFVSDVETEFMDVLVPQDLHHFEIDGRRIYHYYDVRHLFKSARDALMQYNFHVDSKVVQWSHILKVYDKDNSHDLSLMPDITEKHVRPAGKSLEDVNLAIEVFSKPVAAAMSFHVTANMASQKYRDTVDFITNMRNLFDVLIPKTFAGAYRGTTEQNQVLLSVLEYLQGLEVKDKHGNVVEGRFVTGLIVNIRSVLALFEDLKQESLQYLITKVLSKDCVEAYFDECRRLGGNCCERPTSIMFARSFRRLFLVSLVHNTKDGENEQDLKSTLYNIGDYIQADLVPKKDEPEEKFRRILVGINDFRIQWPSTEYITGYVLWKCLEKHKCPTFVEKLSSLYGIPVENDAATLIGQFKKYNADNVGRDDLWKPPEALVDFIDRIDHKYFEYFSGTGINRVPVRFGWNTYHYMEEDTFEMPCECFPLKFLKILFIRLRLDHSVREYNKVNKNPRRARPQPMKIKRKKKQQTQATPESVNVSKKSK